MKPVLYLLPGLMCDASVWAAQQASLHAGFEVRIPVFRGFDSLRDMALHVLNEAPPQFCVAGHSMGGRVAFELMQMAGNRITRFAVLDTGAHPVSPDEPAKRQLLLQAARRKGLQAVADAWIEPMLHPHNRENSVLRKQINDMILRNTVTDYAGQVNALLGRSDQQQYLPRIQQPVLLICGEADSWSPVAQHEHMASLIGDATLQVIPGAGHMSTMEQPALVSALLTEWLNGN